MDFLKVLRRSRGWTAEGIVWEGVSRMVAGQGFDITNCDSILRRFSAAIHLEGKLARKQMQSLNVQ